MRFVEAFQPGQRGRLELDQASARHGRLAKLWPVLASNKEKRTSGFMARIMNLKAQRAAPATSARIADRCTA